jgi:hypothetical protein
MRATFGEQGDVTHLVYAALQERQAVRWLARRSPDGTQLTMLRNLFEPLSKAARGLQHGRFCTVPKRTAAPSLSGIHEGVKIRYAGARTAQGPSNFYFLQEDYLAEKRKGSEWAVTVYRPTVIYGVAPGNNMNPTLAIAVYASLLRERGEPLHFPGQEGSPVIREAVDARLVARAIAWGATAREARNETFNLTNGDVRLGERMAGNSRDDGDAGGRAPPALLGCRVA